MEEPERRLGIQVKNSPGQTQTDQFWRPLAIAFKGVAMAMAAVTVALVILGEGDAGTYGIFLAVGLFSVAIGSLMDHRRGPTA